MATQIHHAPVSPVGAGFFARLSSAAAFVGRTLAFASAGQARFDQIQRLQALSDDELAKRGIARDDIVRHVYRDLFYI